ncbi:MAG: glycoside hydrolase family 3 N-terminal domain-containing protein, partial [Bacteroidota bacterium]
MGLVLTGPFSWAQTPAQAWADSVLQTLSLEEKIGQLFMLATFSNQGEKDYAYVERLVREQHLGGLIFMQGTPKKQVDLINRYQKKARLPLLIAQDAEWGLGMRLKNTPRYPKNMTLGAIAEDSLLYMMGQQMAKDLRVAGVTMNFAPVVDVNNNVGNPVINYRSFGENRFNVARKGIMLSHGLRDGGVIACAKHFPGHGDTDTDSHFDLPVIPHSLTRLDTLELYPFAQMAKAGVPAVMVAHLYVPALDSTPNQPTTLSPKVVQGILRDKLNFDGLVVTDALNMHGVTKYNAPGETALKAFMAGNDILLFPRDIPKAARLIKAKIEGGEIASGDLDQRVKRILRAKYGVGLRKQMVLPTDSIKAKLADPMGIALRRRLYEAAITLPKNNGRLIPLR